LLSSDSFVSLPGNGRTTPPSEFTGQDASDL